MKRKKRLLSLVLTVALVMGTIVIPTEAAVAAGETGGTHEGFTWSFDQSTGKLSISGSGALGYGPWKDYKESIKSVELSGEIKTIGRYAFEYNTSMEKITMPKSVTTIAYGAFDHCTALQKVTLPSSLKKIETGAFIFCKSLSKVEVNGGANNTKLKSIDYIAFGGCTKLKSLTIPKKVGMIGDNAYGYNLTEDQLMPSKISGTAIYGVKNSKAEIYAKKNKITFKSVKNTSKIASKGYLKAPVLTAITKKVNGKKHHILTFSKVSDAAGYQIYFSFSSGSNAWWRKLTTLKASQKRYFELAWDSGNSCYYKVRAYKKSGSKYIYGPFSKVKYLK